MTTFVVTDTATAGGQGQQFDKAVEAYRKAREYEAGGRKAVIKLPGGEEVSPQEFERFYLLRDVD
jgi:hypothetical protein